MLSRILLSLIAVGTLASAQTVVTLNTASYRLDQISVSSPGAYASAFPPQGSTFAGVTTSTTGTIPYLTSLGGVTVAIDGTNVPVQFAGPGQINFLVPYTMTPGLKTLKVTSPGGSISGSLRVLSAAPGLFFLTTDTAKPPSARALNQDGVTVNSTTSPVKRGDVISLYGTGPGVFDKTVVDGSAPGGNPLVRTVSTPQVLIGGVEANVGFSGLSPQFPGLWQLNVTVPSQSFITGRVPVVVFVDGVDSNEVTIVVQ